MTPDPGEIVTETQRREVLSLILRAQEGERSRVARDLHDQVGQTLTLLSLEVGLLERAIMSGKQAEELCVQLSQLRDTVALAAGEVRAVAFNLRPTSLDDIGLEAALSGPLRDWSRRTGIEVKFHANGLLESLAEEPSTAAFRIVQEALTNVARHAQASTVSVFVRRTATALRGAIEDDGVGFTPPAPGDSTAGYLGLKGMAERVALVGGRLRIESRPGAGAAVAFLIPL
ncbi:MAG: hypothetical protein NVS3B24_13910 [Candidatus Dormibacteria bacterium]